MLRNRRWRLLTLIIGGLVAVLVGPMLLPSGQTEDPYSLVYSTSSNHSDPNALNGAEVSGSIYVFTTPDEGVDDVTFYLDDQLVWVEDNSPFDFAGGDRTTANPWDTTRVADGTHTIRAELLLTDGALMTTQASFTVNNTGSQPGDEPTPTSEETASPTEEVPAPYGLVLSESADRAAPVVLENATVSGSIYVFTTPDENVDDVTFYLDGQLVWAEKNPPFDFAGGNRNQANPWDTTRVADGPHTITAQMLLTDGSLMTISASFTVNNSGGSEPTPTPTEEPVEPTPTPTEESAPGDPSGNQVRLVDSYVVKVQSPGYDQFKYRPRQFTNGLVAPSHKGDKQVTDAGVYNGWDVLITRNTGGARVLSADTWFTVRLARKAQVAIVWQDKDTPPQWLTSWPKAGTVSIGGDEKQVYLKTFNAGDFNLGSVWDTGGNGPYGRETYLVLFAEADGQPTLAPAVPAGQTVPTPNETCPTWVHDQYMTQGPDGRMYRTWHPQIDPVYWCYFRHDHGSNPAYFGDGSYSPPFGYAGHQHGMAEAHAGYKVFVGNVDGNTQFIITVHMGSHGSARYCARFHEMDLAIWDNGKLVAELYLVGDFGKSVYNRTHEPFSPAACPNQGNISEVTYGVRQLPSLENYTGYEPWRMDLANSFDAVGLDGNTVTFWTNDAIVVANDATASGFTALANNNDANHVLHNIQDMVVRDAPHNGTFYTDPRGDSIVDSSDPHAVRQFIAPGTFVDFNGVAKCRDLEGWGRPLICGLDNPPDEGEEREGSLGPEWASLSYMK